MEEFIFYTTEGFALDPKGNCVENCQLLGMACGEDKADALDNLLKENPFILEHGFDPCKFISRKLARTDNNLVQPPSMNKILADKI